MMLISLCKNFRHICNFHIGNILSQFLKARNFSGFLFYKMLLDLIYLEKPYITSKLFENRNL